MLAKYRPSGASSTIKDDLVHLTILTYVGKRRQSRHKTLDPNQKTSAQLLIVSHIFSGTRDEVSVNLISCWLRTVNFLKRSWREFVRGSRTIRS